MHTNQFNHEFRDSLNSFCKSNPDRKLNIWINSLSKNDLSRLKDQLIGAIAPYSSHTTNQITDIHLLAFEIASMNRKRRVMTMQPEKRMTIIKALYDQVSSIG